MQCSAASLRLVNATDEDDSSPTVVSYRKQQDHMLWSTTRITA